MTGKELLEVLKGMSDGDLGREVVLPIQHTPTACQKVILCQMGGLDSQPSYVAVKTIFLGDYTNVNDEWLRAAGAKIVINKNRDGRTFKR